MARVIVGCWQETYQGLMADTVLDDPNFLASRERFWTAVLTEERFRANRVAVAERDSDVIGVAMSGPSLDTAAAWTRQLYVLYVYAAHHGSGAGSMLLDAVVDPQESVALWVAQPNPRAQARSTAITDSSPTEQTKSTTECRRFAWSAPTSHRRSAARPRCRRDRCPWHGKEGPH